MSVHLHVGQCGNQLGAAFYRCLKGAKKAVSLPRQLFHPSTGAARCILVDSEPKVIRAVCHEVIDGAVACLPAYAHVEQAGRGNNWARRTVELVMDSLRHEIEGVDCYQGSVVMHSLGGEPGRDWAVDGTVLHSRRYALQNYNAVLTLKCLQDVADAVIYKDNDELLRTAGYWKAMVQGSDNNQRVSLEEVNSMAAADLAGLLFPVEQEMVALFDRSISASCCTMYAPCLRPRYLTSVPVLARLYWIRHKQQASFQNIISENGLISDLVSRSGVAQARLLSRRHEHAQDFDASLDMLEKLVQQTAACFPRNSHATMHRAQ
ncbi:Tubulin/FtsZ, GTPase domain [Phytophthora cactorum]|nr:Tubulin/FtsZ, GTPase domain [Phytophthora cactorum]